jgi:hypothetical protein
VISQELTVCLFVCLVTLVGSEKTMTRPAQLPLSPVPDVAGLHAADQHTAEMF